MRTGFWAAVLLGAIGLASMVISPVMGLAQAALFFAAAWGIRRGRPWAALAALAMVTAPVLAVLLQGAGRCWAQLAIWTLLIAALAALFGYTAVVLFRRRGAGFLAGNDWMMAVFILIVLAACFSFRPYMMPAGSMGNTLQSGDLLLVDVASPALGWRPGRDSLVVFRPPTDPGQTFVKRVAGVEGDRIRFQDKRLVRNGVALEEPWAIHVSPHTETYRDNFPRGEPPSVLPAPARDMLERAVRNGEVVVPAGMLFVLGDNRDNSLDSRYFGLVPKADVVGRPLLVYGSTAAQARFQWVLRRL
ncbi:MAG: signal peptidase I [Bryobacteraceae bacterium]